MKSMVLIVIVFGAAVVASVAALMAVGLDRFERVTAGFLALLGGIAPWLAAVPVFNGYAGYSFPVWVAGFFGSAPLFTVAAILYGAGKREGKRPRAALASIIGMFAGGVFTATLHSLLSGAE